MEEGATITESRKASDGKFSHVIMAHHKKLTPKHGNEKRKSIDVTPGNL